MGRTERSLKGVILICALLVAWEAFSRLYSEWARYFPPVSTIMRKLVELAMSREGSEHILTSLLRVFHGYGWGVLAGLVLGSISGMSRLFYELIEPLVELLRPLPSVAILPIVILFVGVGDAMNVLIIAYATTWPIFINTLEGVRGVDLIHENTGRMFGLRGPELVRKVMIPSALPFIVSGLRVSFGLAVVVVISTEMVGSSKGLGYLIIESSLSDRIPEMYAVLVMIGLLGYALNECFRAVESRAMAWHRGFTAKARVF